MKKNLIVTTQGSNLQIYDKIFRKLNYNGKIGFYTSFYRNFKNFKNKHDRNFFYLKEWEIFRESNLSKKRINFAKLNQIFKPGILWNSILSDRRLIYGKHCKYLEDYKCRFRDNELYKLIFTFVESFEKFFNFIKPDVLVGSVPVTFGEYLAIKYCEKKNIPTLQFHSSRLSNYFSLHDKTLGSSSHFLKIKKRGTFSVSTKAEAKKIIKNINSNGIIYEGVSVKKKSKIKIFNFIRDLLYSLKGEYLKYMDPISRNDHHDPGFISYWFVKNLLYPLKIFHNQSMLKKSKRLFSFNDLKDIGEFCFFPLHTEPEVSIQILGRPYHKNQIELLRNLGASLPFGMKLLVKEHPRSIGKRSSEFYERLLEIPNLFFIDSNLGSFDIVTKSKFISVISSTIGLEAIIMKKPVLVLGFPKYGDIFEKGIIRCYNLFELPQKIQKVVEMKTLTSKDILRSVCSIIEGSVAVNFYSKILKKKDRFSKDNELLESQELDILINYFNERINKILKRT